MGLVVHHRDLGVLLRLEEYGVQLGEDETAELDYPGEREGVGEDDGPDLVISAHHVQGHEGEPVDRVDRVREQDEPGLIEAARTLSRLESIERGRDYQEEGEEEASHEARVHARADQDPDVLLKDVFCRGRLKDQPADINTNLTIIITTFIKHLT